MHQFEQKMVVVAMSGGVDSAVAAALMKQSGHRVVGVYMRLWCEQKSNQERSGRSCCSEESTELARQVCGTLSIPFYVLDFTPEFENHVINYFRTEYTKGRTPNPCIACNRYVKFHHLLERSLHLSADYLATGHYARIIEDKKGFHLLKANDNHKDQSYVIYMLGQAQLKHLLFPVGPYLKSEVREIARKLGLPVAAKTDSQDLCFVAGDYRKFMALDPEASTGEVVNTIGEVLGHHAGLASYTIGQRYNFHTTPGRRTYVVRIDLPSNRLVVGEENDLLLKEMVAGEVSWVSGLTPEAPVRIAAKIRYRSLEAPATLYPLGDSVRVIFDLPQRAITPGQAVVFYHHDEVLGGATIRKTVIASRLSQAYVPTADIH